MAGIGSVCHVEPAGNVPVDKKVDLRPILVPLDSIRLESPAKGTGVWWKQASVSWAFSGHSLYWYPPPWFVRAAHSVVWTEPWGQTAPENILGKTWLPRSPNFANVVFVNCNHKRIRVSGKYIAPLNDRFACLLRCERGVPGCDESGHMRACTVA